MSCLDNTAGKITQWSGTKYLEQKQEKSGVRTCLKTLGTETSCSLHAALATSLWVVPKLLPDSSWEQIMVWILMPSSSSVPGQQADSLWADHWHAYCCHIKLSLLLPYQHQVLYYPGWYYLRFSEAGLAHFLSGLDRVSHWLYCWHFIVFG